MTPKATPQEYLLHLSPSPLLNASRLIRMGRTLQRLGTDANVVLVGMKADDNFDDEQVEDRLMIQRVSAGPRWLGRVGKIVFWSKNVLTRYWRRRPAVVSAHSVWTLPLAMLLRLRHGMPVVYNPHELETRTPRMTGLRRHLAQTIELTFLTRCHAMTVVNESIADWYRERYPELPPIAIYNFPARRALEAHSTGLNLREIAGASDEELVFVHTGRIAPGRNVELLVETFERLAKHHVVFLGSGALLDVVQDASGRSRFIHQHPPLAVDEVVPAVATADMALCLVDTTSESYALSSPNKLFEALAAGIPPLCSNLEEAKHWLGKGAARLVLNDPSQELRGFLETVTRAEIVSLRRLLVPLPTWDEQEDALLQVYRQVMPKTGHESADSPGTPPQQSDDGVADSYSPNQIPADAVRTLSDPRQQGS